ncbi:MAG: hydroxyacid dehydrogenase [Caldilineaceae bacterium]
MPTQPNIYVLLRPTLYQELFSHEADRTLRTLGQLTFHPNESNLSSAELAQRIGPFDAIITGWGTPEFTDEVLDAAPRLKLIAHSAGSIKKMLPPAVFDRGIAVTHAAVAIAPAVAEMTLLLILLSLRQVHKLDQAMKTGGPWEATKLIGMGQEIVGSRIGVVGAGYTGRCVIKLLTALEAEVWVFDPYLTIERAAELGVRKVDLDALLQQCPVVTMQAPPTTETYHIIGQRELSLLQDGAIFINTARAHLVDQDALLAELRTGRIQGALDVFDQEPLPLASPFRQLDNVIVTPHVAGASRQARLRQGQTMVDEVQRFLHGEPLRYQVAKAMLETMA